MVSGNVVTHLLDVWPAVPPSIIGSTTPAIMAARLVYDHYQASALAADGLLHSPQRCRCYCGQVPTGTELVDLPDVGRWSGPDLTGSSGAECDSSRSRPSTKEGHHGPGREPADAATGTGARGDRLAHASVGAGACVRGAERTERGLPAGDRHCPPPPMSLPQGARSCRRARRQPARRGTGSPSDWVPLRAADPGRWEKARRTRRFSRGRSGICLLTGKQQIWRCG